MGWKVINEAASAGGGASTVGELNDIDTTGVEDGDALIRVGGNFVPQKVILAEQLVHVNHVSTANNDELNIHLAVQDKIGGRIVLDLDAEGGSDVHKIILDELLSRTPVTMNFEIFSKGTKPFSVLVENDGQDNIARSLKSFVSSPVDLADGASEPIEVGEGQMMILFCDGVDWYYEIRSGL